jgi:maltose alpha-D-glucosyltransferase/alpha-amylase
MVKPEQLPQPGDLDRARRLWYGWASATVLSSYLEASRDASFTATDPLESRILLDAFLLERALVELRNELGNRPDRVRIPLEGIMQILSAPQPQGGCP